MGLQFMPGSSPDNLLAGEIEKEYSTVMEEFLKNPLCPSFLKEEMKKAEAREKPVTGKKGNDGSEGDDESSETEDEAEAPQTKDYPDLYPGDTTEGRNDPHMAKDLVQLYDDRRDLGCLIDLQNDGLEGVEENSDSEGSEVGDIEIKDFLKRGENQDWQKSYRDLGLNKDPEKFRDFFSTFIDNNRSFADLGKRFKDANIYNARNLNAKQKVAYKILKKWTKRAIASIKADEKLEQLLMHVNGKAGCGKTFFLQVYIMLVEMLIKKNKISPNFLKVSAPTGTAAFAIGGETLHSLLQIPVPTNPNDPAPEKSGDALAVLQHTFKGTQILVIDEKSMISTVMMYQIDERLKQAFPEHSKEPFGGISVVLMGDFSQLPPVQYKSLYDTKQTTGFPAKGKMRYKLFDKCVEFDEIMRQGEGQEEFRDILNSLADGTFNDDHYKKLQSRSMYNMTDEEKEQVYANSTMICAKVNDLKPFNLNRIKKLKGLKAISMATNDPDIAAKFRSSKAGGLPNATLYTEGAKVMITGNLWKAAGLVNGATGQIVKVVYLPDRQPPMRPDMVLVKVPQYLGPSCLENEDKVVPIVERTSFWMDKKTSCTRKALPLVPSYAISIHKSQGSGLEQVIVNLSEREFAVGLTYTALSRCKTLEGLYFETIPPKDRMTRHFGWQNFTDKLEEDKRLKKLEEETLANVDITDILTDEEEEEDEEMVQ